MILSIDGAANLRCLARQLALDARLTVPHRAYMLATVRWECGPTSLRPDFQPRIERGPDSYFAKYDGRQDLGNLTPGDGFRYRGRGFVQITGRGNYDRVGTKLDVDLTNNPEMALEWTVAYDVMTAGMINGWFTGRKLSTYLGPTLTDYVNARRMINGLDHADQIAGFAVEFAEMFDRCKI